MILFNKIEGYIHHGFYKTNFNLNNDGMMIQLNIKGVLINRCIYGVKKGVMYFKYKNKKWCLFECHEKVYKIN